MSDLRNNDLVEPSVISGYIHEDVGYFEGVDFERVEPIEHPILTQCKKRLKDKRVNGLSLMGSPIVSWKVSENRLIENECVRMIRSK